MPSLSPRIASTPHSGIRRMAADLMENADVRILISTAGSPYPLGAAMERNLFRIVQEAVANAIRHATARQIDVDVRFSPDTVRIMVSDDGRGFDTLAASGGFGLTSMRERAGEIGASFDIESRTDSGTSVTVTVLAARGVSRASDRGQTTV